MKETLNTITTLSNSKGDDMTTMEEIYLQTEALYLRTPKREDFGETMVNWINDPEVTKYLSRGIFPANPEALEAEFNNLKTSNQQEVQLAVCDKKTGKYIGITGLHCLNWLARHGEFRILIGEKEAWGQGYGSEATQMMTAYGFERLNLNKVWLGVNAENQRAIGSYKRAGFVIEGEFRNELFRNGKYYNIIRMSILKDEYIENYKQWSTVKWIEKQFLKQQS
jgi:RimJ/RimL family protein N-acetyltransferase